MFLDEYPILISLHNYLLSSFSLLFTMYSLAHFLVANRVITSSAVW